MLERFIGAYLFQPAAFDYSTDTCRNGCAYCFANINKATRSVIIFSGLVLCPGRRTSTCRRTTTCCGSSGMILGTGSAYSGIAVSARRLERMRKETSSFISAGRRI